MKPVVAIVGRPNVGKSTLFNRLTRSRDAIVHGIAGVTRDRHYGEARLERWSFIAIDTGGLDPEAGQGLAGEMTRQAEQAIAEADAVLFVVDGRSGPLPDDRAIAERLRTRGARVVLTVNKCEGLEPHAAVAEFHALGLGAPVAISAAHGEGIHDLVAAALGEPHEAPDDAADEATGPRVAVVGRPNVGKSTLVNALAGEPRVIAFDEPGTTRDAIEVPFRHAGRRYVLVDTAGLRRRGQTHLAVEKFSIVKTLQAIEASNVVVLLLDALEGVTEQDAHIAGYILERGRAVVLAVNKWDAADAATRSSVKQALGWKLGFLGFADTHFLSARLGRGLAPLMRSVNEAHAAAFAKLSTPRLTRALIAAVARQAPPRKGPIRPKPRYAHQGGSNPPRIVIHGNALDRVPASYRRYLEGVFRETFALRGTPLSVEFRTGRNPYAGRKRGR
jgi:GTP-binding protein